jgi:hypothetical protein
MPQPKKHASPAARQAAYRQRCEQALQVTLAGKGLPALPVIATMPGWPRWNASFRSAHDLIAETLGEMQDYFEDRSDAWKDGERGEEHQEKTASLEAILDALSDLLS